jgi:DNA-binding response OmpR family regulator
MPLAWRRLSPDAEHLPAVHPRRARRGSWRVAHRCASSQTSQCSISGLPDTDGYEPAALIRAQLSSANVRLIALSGDGQHQDRLRSQTAGFSDHIVKPVDISHLLQLVSMQ